MGPLDIGIVTQHVPDQRQVQCAFKTSGQTLTLNVHVGMPYGDALRIKQEPLPGIGSTGLIAFPFGNPLNAIWIKTIFPSGMDAIHAPGDQNLDPHIDYEAFFSGHWNMLDAAGNYAVQFADGSALTVASGTTLPQPMRHIVAENNERKNVPYTRAERVTNPPAPFKLNWQGAEGFDVTSDGAGNVTITATSLTLNIGGKSFVFDSAGLHGNADIKTSGSVVAGNGGGDQVTLQTHKHPTAATGSPSSPTAGT
jgi:hypothetical protein